MKCMHMAKDEHGAQMECAAAGNIEITKRGKLSDGAPTVTYYTLYCNRHFLLYIPEEDKRPEDRLDNKTPRL